MGEIPYKIVCEKVECARGRTARQCHQGLQEACGESALPYRTVARWVKAFNEGHPNVADMLRPGRPSVSDADVQAVAALMDSDCRQTIRQPAGQTGLAPTTVLHILKERLSMRKIASRWVPHQLTEMQKWLRYDAARTHLERYEREGDAFLRRIITLDETWARLYQPELKRQSNEWRHHGSPRRSKFRQNPSNVKVMVILVYDCDGVILTHTVPPQQTVTAQYYCSFLEHNLRPALRKKRRHFLQNAPLILHDNARPHAAQTVTDLFKRWSWEVLYHPPYSPDLSPWDYDLIPKMD
ncbi:Mariner Mos1 transposase, partial [Stegodyphus mimosarum]